MIWSSRDCGAVRSFAARTPECASGHYFSSWNSVSDLSMDITAEECVDVAERPKPKFKFLKKGEGTHKRVFAPKLKQQETFKGSFSAKIDIAAATGEYESHQSENSQLENQHKTRGNKSRNAIAAHQPEPMSSPPSGPQAISGTSWPCRPSGGSGACIDESTEMSASDASAFHAVRTER